ncbi:MAG: glycerophosphodiester phosphodiesterase family protein [Pseudomonadota bacterium]
MRYLGILAALALALALALPTSVTATGLKPDERTLYLLDAMSDSPLKRTLDACRDARMTPRNFSISHRGAPARYAEHTAASYRAGAAQGAGIVECDVTFTRDKALVCRHAQDDLARTTNVLETPFAQRCASRPSGASWEAPGTARCSTADLTLKELLSLEARMDSRGQHPALAPAAGTRVMTHRDAIRLIDELGRDFTPELKRPSVPMPFDGLTLAGYAQALIDDYKALGISPERVWPQSFRLADVRYWIAEEPDFGRQAIYLDGRYRNSDFNAGRPDRLTPSMAALKAEGVNFLAPPLWVLLTLEADRIVPSAYARAAKDAGLELVAWTMERSGPLGRGGGWYFQSVRDAIRSDGQFFEVLHVLAKDVGVRGVFSDWPAPVTFYANCMGLP